jgi:hypothetical protein
VDDVAEVRALLRRSDATARDLAVATIRSWQAHRLDVLGARAVLEAAGGSYPALPADEVAPAVRLVELLWDAPRAVDPADVVRVHLISGEPVQRGLLHLLALRGGDEGLAALEVLLGPDADPWGIPRLTGPLLGPLLIQVDRSRVARLLVGLLDLPGWRWHAAELLEHLDTDGDLGDDVWAVLAGRLADLVRRLTGECDRAMGAHQQEGEPGRTARSSLSSLVPLVARQVSRDAVAGAELALRMLASADPRVAALGAGILLRHHEPVAPDRLEVIGRDPIARIELVDLLGPDADTPPLPASFDHVSLEEGRLARQLAEVHELGRLPDELEHVASVPVEARSGGGVAEVFRFRLHSPHWSAARGWMVGVAGPFTATCYAAEDEYTPRGHVDAVRAALADWPDRADGAA